MSSPGGATVLAITVPVDGVIVLINSTKTNKNEDNGSAKHKVH